MLSLRQKIGWFTFNLFFHLYFSVLGSKSALTVDSVCRPLHILKNKSGFPLWPKCRLEFYCDFFFQEPNET